MGISMSRTAGLIALGGLLLVLLSSCTLTGADAPPLTLAGSTDGGQQPATQEPATQEPPLGLPETPTTGPRIDAFLTLTAEAGDPFGPGGTGATPTEMGGEIIPPTAVEGLPTPLPVSVTPTPITPMGTPGTPIASVPGTADCPATYTVQAGDTLFRIALRFGLTISELAAANNITNPALIQAGTILSIPHCGDTSGSGGGSQDSGGERMHVVQPGENLYRIALKYNLSWQRLAEYNGITNPDSIYAGQVLRIPPS